MNDNIKEEICKLRTEGYRYQEIADVFSLSVNTVKSFCLRNNVQANGKPTKQISEYHFCRCCGKRIGSANKRRRVFCSQECKQRWWKENPDKINRVTRITVICKNCGKSFPAYEAEERVFCSRQCYMRYRSVNRLCTEGKNHACSAEQN